MASCTIWWPLFREALRSFWEHSSLSRLILTMSVSEAHFQESFEGGPTLG